jgi:hypothetical protein
MLIFGGTPVNKEPIALREAPASMTARTVRSGLKINTRPRSSVKRKDCYKGYFLATWRAETPKNSGWYSTRENPD